MCKTQNKFFAGQVVAVREQIELANTVWPVGKLVQIESFGLDSEDAAVVSVTVVDNDTQERSAFDLRYLHQWFTTELPPVAAVRKPRKKRAAVSTDELQATAQQLLTLAIAANAGKIRAGYYSIDGKRYKLDAPTDGKWSGWLFLKTGSDYWEQNAIAVRKPDGEFTPRTSEHGKQVLALIIADPIQAMLDYAAITGVCGVCGRKLEDPVSVAIGIGPICLNKVVGG